MARSSYQHSVLAKCLISDKFKHVIDVFPHGCHRNSPMGMDDQKHFKIGGWGGGKQSKGIYVAVALGSLVPSFSLFFIVINCLLGLPPPSAYSVFTLPFSSGTTCPSAIAKLSVYPLQTCEWERTCITGIYGKVYSLMQIEMGVLISFQIFF